jgi:hypothetical protein
LSEAAPDSEPQPVVQRQEQHVDGGLDHRRDAAEGERAGHRVHDGESHRHVQKHLTCALGCDYHASNIGTPGPRHQLEVTMSAFNAGYRAP